MFLNTNYCSVSLSYKVGGNEGSAPASRGVRECLLKDLKIYPFFDPEVHTQEFTL